MSVEHLSGNATLHPGDCLLVLPTLPADSIDSCVTDPPYELKFMGKGWSERAKGDIVTRTGTALHPGAQTIVLTLDKKSRAELKREHKPYERFSTDAVAANVLKWGTGALNVDGCRVGTGEDKGVWPITDRRHADVAYTLPPTETDSTKGRWPANVIHDGSDEVVGAFPDAPGQQRATGPEFDRNANVYGKFAGVTAAEPRGDSGSAARFFYTAKADSDDRLGSKHPTVKPVDLIQYLVRLVTPPKGLVLDLFAGTGTTGEACIREGFKAILIEREAEYCEDIRRRMKLTMSGPDERARESIKARSKDKPHDHGPLFGVQA